MFIAIFKVKFEQKKMSGRGKGVKGLGKAPDRLSQNTLFFHRSERIWKTQNDNLLTVWAVTPSFGGSHLSCTAHANILGFTKAAADEELRRTHANSTFSFFF